MRRPDRSSPAAWWARHLHGRLQGQDHLAGRASLQGRHQAAQAAATRALSGDGTKILRHPRRQAKIPRRPRHHKNPKNYEARIEIPKILEAHRTHNAVGMHAL